MEVSITSERPSLDHADDGVVLYMLTITAQATLPAKSDGKSPVPPPSRSAGAQPARAPRPAALTGAATAAAPAAEAADPQSLLDVCCLEGCGLGWRVRPPLVRRSPWTVSAQRMRLCIEALGGAKVDKVYTLLDHHELAPGTSYEVSVGDLHVGDACHVPVLLWLPALANATPATDVLRFSLHYVDAVKIDTKSCELCASIARPTVRCQLAHEHSPLCRTKRFPAHAHALCVPLPGCLVLLVVLPRRRARPLSHR